MAVTPYALSLVDLEVRARQRAGMVGSNFVSTGEVQDYLENAYKELYLRLVGKYEGLFVEYYATSLAAGIDTFIPLTGGEAILKPLGLLVQNTGGNYVPLRRIDLAELERVASWTSRGQPAYYCVVGDFKGGATGGIRFHVRPLPNTTYSMRVLYVPQPVKLSEVSGEKASNLAVIPMLDDYLVTRAALEMRDKEESDTYVLQQDAERMLAVIDSALAPLDGGEPAQVVRYGGGLVEDLEELEGLTWSV